MEIKWLGNNSFDIKGSRAHVSIDPTSKSKGDIVVSTSGEVESDANFVFNWPGEFEAQDIIIHSIPVGTGKDEVRIISLEVDGIRICNVGLLEKSLSEEVVADIGEIDVLMIPVTMKQKDAHQLIEDIDPRLVLLSNYNHEGAKAKLPPASEFLKAVGQSGLEAQDKLVVKSKSALDSENIEYAYLSL